MTPEAAGEAAATMFAGLGGDLADPPFLMPAGLPLELSGEAVRARLCMFTDAAGADHALRPDLTLPVAREEVAARRAGLSGERILRYRAPAFRLPSSAGQPMEFTQIGFERFGAASTPDADMAALEAVIGAVDAAGTPLERVWLGDLAVFPAFVDALGLDEAMGEALKRAFRQQGGVTALLKRGASGVPAPLAGRLAGASPAESEAMVGETLRLAGLQPLGARSLSEIAERLVEKANATAGLAEEPRAILTAVLAVEDAPGPAADALAAIAAEAGLATAEPAIERLAARHASIGEQVPQVAPMARFGTPFGRRFNYYDGFVFELFAAGAPSNAPCGAGGRYDGLLARLSGGEVTATAIGGVVRPDRLAGGGEGTAA